MRSNLPKAGKNYLVFDNTSSIGGARMTIGTSQSKELSIFIPNGTWIQVLSVEPDYNNFPVSHTLQTIKERHTDDAEYLEFYLDQWIQLDIRWGDKIFRHCWFSKYAWQVYLWEHSFEDWEPDDASY